MRRPYALLLALSVGMWTTVGCSSDDHAAAPEDTDTLAAGMETAHVHTVNNVCPVGGDPLPENPPVRTYKGYTVGFCCDACPETFMAWDESARDRWLVAVMRDPDYTP